MKNDKLEIMMEMQKKFQEKVGCIEIFDNVFIGSHSVIMYDTKIGPNVIVAAGSVVTKDIPPGSVVGGVPAKVIGSFDDLMKRREIEEYPNQLAPANQKVSSELEEYLWREFRKKTINDN